MAVELEIDLQKIRGSESGGRIVAADLRDYIKRLIAAAARGSKGKGSAAAKAPAERVDFAQWGSILKKPVSPLREVIAYGVQIASALAAAHSAGIVHRDIKPGNIMIAAPEIAGPPGRVKVLAFGLAKLGDNAPAVQSETRTVGPAVTGAGIVMGTAAYMSPEQTRAEAVDARTDLFALGAVLYEMATSRRAFSKA